MVDIKSVRVSKNLTQDDLAKSLNVSRTTVTMWENNKSLPSITTVKKIAEVLGCTVDDLLKEK